MAQINHDSTGIYALSFSPDGKQLAAAGSDGQIRIYQSAEGNQVTEFIPVPIKQ